MSRRGALRRILVVVVGSVLAVTSLLTAPERVSETAGRVLQRLASLDESGVRDFLIAHPAQVFELLNAQPEAAAREWPMLPVVERRKLERAVPVLVGNLDGVSYVTRDRANRTALGSALTDAAKKAAKNPGDQSAVLALAAYRAIHAALAVRGHPSRHLIEFIPGARPTAAIALGDLQTAPLVSWLVPGMGTYTTDMQLWTLAAQNVWTEQQSAGAPAGHAVIAWMGYVVPPVGIDAALGEYASRGAPILAEAIEGLTAYRHRFPPIVTVIAHSYGTTMAADALAGADLGVSAFVMLGSAGVEERIPSAADLHAGAVYAGEAVADDEAALGRLARQDPRSAEFGARILPVDGDAHAGLTAVTGHAPILHSAYNDDIASPVWTAIPSLAERTAAFRRHLAEHGYLDVGTQSLREVGQVTAAAGPFVVSPPSMEVESGPFGLHPLGTSHHSR